MMEAIMTQKVTPLLKCFVLFLFIFTAKVLTSRPNEAHDSRNGIHHVKPSHYVRTFTKYHHRRTIQWNNHELQNYWPVTHEQPKLSKRSVRISDWPYIPYSNENWPVRNKRSLQDSNEFVGQKVSDLNQFSSDIINSGKEDLAKNGLANDVRKYKVKAAIVLSPVTTTTGPTISCLYKIAEDSVARSVTPSYIDEANSQFVVENDNFDMGPVSVMELPSGPTLVEKCTDPKATCYTLWHKDTEGNITVLGQGCWRASPPQTSCDKCTRVTARVPGTQRFCCCTKSFCNADFTSIKEEAITIKAESTMEATPAPNKYSNLVASAILSLAAVLVMAALLHKMYCTKVECSDDVEKGENVMGSGPDALHTGLLCVDNLTLIEHIGQGKFGSVWRGSLGSNPVAVKLYSSANTWQKEAAIYALPHLSHSNILRYYGSDTRPTLTEGGGRDHLIVLELCSCTLRARLERTHLTWLEFATFAHGIASALAHLHTPTGNKPCIVHRDVNSNNVLISGDGTCRLADLGLAQTLRPRSSNTAPTRYTEAGTLRYLAPEALEGALDLSGAGAALCAVDVYALSLVLWEMVWRTSGAHRAAVPPYAPPYHQALPPQPTLPQMQTLVSRNKARPPLPKGPVSEWRALKIASDTCEECWDHDAEARLTAVCVEERMNELKQLVNTPQPHIHDNKLQPPADPNTPETDKNSNCTQNVTCDVTTPLLYPTHIGRNTCIERNTHTNTQHTVELIHKSLKDITISTETPRQNVGENCLSVARIPRRLIQENSLNEIRSYQRPLDYVQNDVSSTDSERAPKDTNLKVDFKEKPKWGIRKFFEKLNRKETEVKLLVNQTKTSIVDKPMNRPANLVLDDERYLAPCLSPPNRTLSPNMMDQFREAPNDNPNQIFSVIVPKAVITERKSSNSSESINKFRNSMSSQSMIKSNSESEDSTIKRLNDKINSASSSRASINLELQYIDSEINSQVSDTSSEDENLMLLSENGTKITMHAMPKEKDVLKETSQIKTITKHNKYSNFDNEFSDHNDKENLAYTDNPVYLAEFVPKPCLKQLSIKRQRSLEHVSELFSSAGDVNLLNPAGRVKTPGDLPVAVRRARRDRALQKGRASESNRLSLYDDRMMFGNSL